MSTPTLSIDFATHRSRLAALFRIVLAIPLVIVIYVYEIATLVAVVIAWFALLITGRYPAALYGFVSGFLRFYMRFACYFYLTTDAYPPISGGEAPDYPVHVSVPERRESYSRLLVLLRIPYLIPLGVGVYVLLLLADIVAVIAWLAIVITARMPGFAGRYLEFAFGWLLRLEALALLLTQSY